MGARRPVRRSPQPHLEPPIACTRPTTDRRAAAAQHGCGSAQPPHLEPPVAVDDDAVGGQALDAAWHNLLGHGNLPVGLLQLRGCGGAGKSKRSGCGGQRRGSNGCKAVRAGAAAAGSGWTSAVAHAAQSARGLRAVGAAGPVPPAPSPPVIHTSAEVGTAWRALLSTCSRSEADGQGALSRLGRRCHDNRRPPRLPMQCSNKRPASQRLTPLKQTPAGKQPPCAHSRTSPAAPAPSTAPRAAGSTPRRGTVGRGGGARVGGSVSEGARLTLAAAQTPCMCIWPSCWPVKGQHPLQAAGASSAACRAGNSAATHQQHAGVILL